jgi:hypothetical protein
MPRKRSSVAEAEASLAPDAVGDAEEENEDEEDGNEEDQGEESRKKRGGKRIRMSQDVIVALIKTRMEFEPRFVAANKSLIGSKKVNELFVDIAKEIDKVLNLKIRRSEEETEEEVEGRFRAFGSQLYLKYKTIEREAKVHCALLCLCCTDDSLTSGLFRCLRHV